MQNTWSKDFVPGEGFLEEGHGRSHASPSEGEEGDSVRSSDSSTREGEGQHVSVNSPVFCFFVFFPRFCAQPSLSIPDSTAYSDASPEGGPRKQNLNPSDLCQMCSSSKKLNGEGGKAL